MATEDSRAIPRSSQTSLNPRKFSKAQIEAARSVSFAKVLTHIGADHRKDTDYKSRAKHSVRVLVGFNGSSHTFVFNRMKWVDDSRKGMDLHLRSGGGAIDFLTYLTSWPFPKIVETCLAASGESSPVPTVSEAGEQIGFPFWPDDCRSLPNEILHSSLFTARNKTAPREQYKSARIAVIRDDAVIVYTGEELRQNDETVWLQLIQLARDYQAGQPVVFVAKHFLEAVGWTLNQRNYEQLRECLTRLQATALSLSSRRLGKGVSMSMVPRFEWRDELTGKSLREWRVTVAPELVKLFSDHRNSWLEWKQRLALPVGLATWLHGYFSSHRNPLPLTYEEIIKGAGLTSSGKDARDAIRRALNELREVGFLADFSLTRTHVNVIRASTSEDD